jgi:WD40 repeat protein
MGFPVSQPPSVFSVNTMSVSSDGNYVAAGTSDSVDSSSRNGSVYLVSLQSQKMVWRDITNDTAISSVAVSSNASYVAAGGGAEVYLFNTEGKLLWTVPTGASVIQVAIAANGSRIAADYGDGIVYLNSAGDVLWNRTFPQGVSSAGFAMSSDGKFVAYGQSEFPTGNETEGSGWGVFYLDSQGNQLWNYTEDDGAVTSVQMSSDGSYVATGSLYSAYNGSAYYFDGRSGALLWKQPALAAVEFLVMSSDGSHIALGGNAGLLLFDSRGTLLYHNATLAPVPVAVSYCDSAVLLSGENGRVQLMGYNGTILATLEVEGLSAEAVFPNSPGWAAVGGPITGAGDCAILHVFDDLSEISSVMLC